MDDFLMPYEVQLEHHSATSTTLMTILAAQRSPGQPATRHLLTPGVYMVYLAYNGAAAATLQHVGGGTTNTSSVAEGAAGTPRTSAPIKISVQGTTEYLQVVAPSTGGSARATISVLPAPTFGEMTGSAPGGPVSSLSSAITPQKFGAKADGVTDDTQAIQAAIDSLPPSGGIVHFPAGTYLVNGAKLRPGSDTTKGAIFLREGVVLLGEGTRSKILLADGTGNVDMLYAKDSADISLQNLVIDAGPRMAYGPGGESDPLHWTTCIQFTGCNNLVMNNVTVTRGNIEGIYLHNCTQFRLDNIRAYDNGLWREDASGLHLDACFNGVASNLVLPNNGFHGLIMSACWECTINNVQCYENGWQGIHMQYGSNKNVINGATLTRNGRGLYIRDWGSDNNLFSDLVVSDNAFNGVMTWVTYGNVINGLQAISNGEFGVQTGVNEDELFVWAGHFKDNGWGDYDSVDDSKLYINGTLV